MSHIKTLQAELIAAFGVIKERWFTQYPKRYQKTWTELEAILQQSVQSGPAGNKKEEK